MTITRSEDSTAGFAVHTWANLSAGEAGEKVLCGARAKSVQVTGTFNSNTLTMQGSNDGINWYTLKDINGNDVTFTAAGLKSIATPCLFIRPSDGGSTGVTLTIILADPRR